MSDIDPKLLSQLRIEGEHRDDDDGRGRRVLWLALAGVLLVAALVARPGGGSPPGR